MNEIPEKLLLSTGEIAQRLNIDRDKVSYAIRKLALQPASVAGQIRIFSENTLPVIKVFLDRKARMNTQRSDNGR